MKTEFDFFAWLDRQPKRPPVPGKRFADAASALEEREEDAFITAYRRLYATHTAVCRAAMELADRGGPGLPAKQKIRQLRQAAKLLRDSCPQIL